MTTPVIPVIPLVGSKPAAPTSGAPTDELGHVRMSGAGFWQVLEQESTPELRWPLNLAVYDRMRRTDAQVISVLRAVTLPILSTRCRVDPEGCRPEVAQLVAEDLGLPLAGEDKAPKPPRTRDRFSFAEHLRHALLMLPFGFMAFEQVYRLDAQGRLRLRKLAPRMPRTIKQMHVATDGGLESIEQWPSKPGEQGPVLGVDRLVVYVHEQEAGDWFGTSVLRAAYKNWLLKDPTLRVWVQSIDRNGMGVPIYEGAEGETNLDKGKAIAQGYRSGSTAGAAIPNGAKLHLAGVEGSLIDPEPAVRYQDEQIARAVLAHFLNLGTQTGSWALGSTFADFFTLSLQALATQVATVLTQHVVEDLVDLNFGPDEPAPRIVFDEIGARSPATAEAIKALRESGVLTADAGLEQFVRNLHGIPALDPTSAVGASPKEIAEMMQKVYLAVGKVITAEEARSLLNRAGASLAAAVPDGLVPPTDAERQAATSPAPVPA